MTMRERSNRDIMIQLAAIAKVRGLSPRGLKLWRWLQRRYKGRT